MHKTTKRHYLTVKKMYHSVCKNIRYFKKYFMYFCIFIKLCIFYIVITMCMIFSFLFLFLLAMKRSIMEYMN